MAEPRPAGAPLDDLELLSMRTLRRAVSYWPVVIACALVAGVAGYLSASRDPKVYKATSMLQISDVDMASLVSLANLPNAGQDPETRTDTIAKVVAQQPVLARAAAMLPWHPTTAQLAGSVSASAQRKSTLIGVTVSDGDPHRAAAIADAVAAAYVSVRRDRQRGRLAKAEQGLREQVTALTPAARNSKDARSLRRRLLMIGSLQAAADGGVETAQPANVPTAAASPHAKRSALLAFVLGGAAGVALALLFALLDRRVRDEDELAELTGAPVLASMPRASGTVPARRIDADVLLERLALVRAALPSRSADGQPLRVLVTGAREGDGVTVAAWGLAVASALAGARVAYVEADLRRPTIAAQLGLPLVPGCSEAIEGLVNVDAAVHHVKVDAAGRSVTIDVIGGGAPAPAPAALLERPEVGDAFDTWGATHDVVVIDAPQLLDLADARFLARTADGVVGVGALGRLTRRDATRFAAALAALDAPLIGVVANAGTAAGAARTDGLSLRRLIPWARPSRPAATDTAG